MTDDRESDALYPDLEDPKADGVSRRRLLRASTATGTAAATAGCAGPLSGSDDDDSATVFVFNTGDKTVSIVDPETDEVVDTQYLGGTASFPANQYTPRLSPSTDTALWLNVIGGVEAVDPRTLETVTSVETGSKANWQVLTPDGERLVVSARESVHEHFRVDADPTSEAFGTVTARIDRSDEPARRGGPGPAGLTVGPEGDFAYVPDVFADTLTVIDVQRFEIVAQRDLEPIGAADVVRPWMASVTWGGDRLLVSNHETEHGTLGVWDVTDPTAPRELARLTHADGLGELPLTAEIGPDGESAFAFTPRSEDVTVVDVAERTVTDRIDLGGKAFVGTWSPDREKLYVAVQTEDVVRVVDPATNAVTETIQVGAKPYGVTAANARPNSDTVSEVVASLAALDLDLPGEANTYCVDECHCGIHEDPSHSHE